MCHECGATLRQDSIDPNLYLCPDCRRAYTATGPWPKKEAPRVINTDPL